MLTEACKQQLRDCCRLGFRNQYGEELDVDIKNMEEKWDNWDCTTVHEGNYASIGLKRFYIADERINLKDKNHIPYRGTIMSPLEKDIIIIQSVMGDNTILRLIGTPKDIKYIKDNVRPDNELNLGMSYRDFVEANRRDLEFHKRIKTTEAIFNKSPERFDSEGNVITSLDHFDNYQYDIYDSEGHVYDVYNAEKRIRNLERKVIYLEEKLSDNEYKMSDKDIDIAIDCIMRLSGYEIKRYLEKKGEYVYNNINEISFQTELTKGEVWKVWRYLQIINLEENIEKINKEIKELENI